MQFNLFDKSQISVFLYFPTSFRLDPTLYILYSSRIKKYYTGSCENLEIRLAKHKEQLYKNSFSSITDDWNLYFSVNDLEYKQARKIEMHIKKMKSKVYIENLSKYPEIIERLKEKYK